MAWGLDLQLLRKAGKCGLGGEKGERREGFCKVQRGCQAESSAHELAEWRKLQGEVPFGVV